MFSRNQDEAFERYFRQKAYEIGYALFRVAGSISRKTFGEALERQALSLLEIVSRGEYAKVRPILGTTEYFLNFGRDVGLLHPANAEAICRELEACGTAIAEFETAASEMRQEDPAINFDDIFSAALPIPVAKDSNGNEANSGKARDEERRQDYRREADSSVAAEMLSVENGSGVAKATMRQSAILERIRQNGNCRLKDIQEFLPEASERTLRYDIQNLIERKLVERIGNGGPATYYRITG